MQYLFRRALPVVGQVQEVPIVVEQPPLPGLADFQVLADDHQAIGVPAEATSTSGDETARGGTTISRRPQAIPPLAECDTRFAVLS